MPFHRELVYVCLCLSSMKNRFKFLQRISFLFHVAATVRSLSLYIYTYTGVTLFSIEYTYTKIFNRKPEKKKYKNKKVSPFCARVVAV